MRMTFVLALAGLLCACDPQTAPTPALEVYLRSDLSAAELAGSRVEATFRTDVVGLAPGPRSFAVEDLALVQIGSSGGALVGVYEGLEAARFDVTLTFRGGGADGRTGSAVVDFVADGAQQVVVLVLRDAATCATDTDCPASPCADERCEDGLCFVTRTASWSEACACDVDVDCPGAGECGTGRCVDHVCEVAADDEACGATGVCRADLSCDLVSCRGREAGDECRTATGPCDRGERCVAGERECPPDRVRGVGEACSDAGARGFCEDDGSGALSCDTSCVAGEPCQIDCRTGHMQCTPEPTCVLESDAADGTTCAPGSTCVAASTCLDGACVPGSITVGAFCGDDPFAECVGRPTCTAEGVCEVQLVAPGTPCGDTSPVCQALACSATGICAANNLATDERCPPTRVGDCGVAICGTGLSGEWTCTSRTAPDYESICGASPPCYQRTCLPSTLRCVDIPAFDYESCACGENYTGGFYCENQVCVGCSPCVDGIQDGGESDIDCGGDVECPACEPGRRCTQPYDCVTGACLPSGVCASWECVDGVQGGDESDVDCGGADCGACGLGLACRDAADCLSLNCDAGVCVCPGPGPICE